MKFKFFFLFLVLFAITLTSCNDKKVDLEVTEIIENINDNNTKTFQVKLNDGSVLSFTTEHTDVIVTTVEQNEDGTYLVTLSNGKTHTIVPNMDYGNVSSISFTDEVVYIKINETKDLSLSFSGDKLNEELIKWNSSTSNVLISKGKIVGISSGYAIITATYGELQANCYVIITEQSSFSLNEEKLVLEKGETNTLEVFKNGEAYSNVLWSSSNNSVVTVSNGVVTAVNPGKAVITAYVHGVTFSCVTVVSGVDGDLSEWVYNGEELYKSITITDALHEERYCKIFARITKDGIYYGGYAYHATSTKDQNVWHKNTNFEVFLYQDNKSIQYYASEGFRSAGAESYLTTYINSNSINIYDKYYTVFELFVPIEITGKYVGTSVAFKTPGEPIAQVVGNTKPELNISDWWWKDLHYPGNKNELYYVYQDGIYGGVLND